MVVCAIIGAALCGFAAPLGAMAVGLEKGGWNWQFIPFVVGGWVGGAVIALILFLIGLNFRDRDIWPYSLLFIGPPITALVLGAVSYPLFVYAEERRSARAQAERAEFEARYDALYDKLRADPTLAFRDKWHLRRDEYGRVFGDSLRNGDVAFTLEQLKALYEESPAASAIFLHPACDTEFLAAHFDEAYEKALQVNYGMLAAIVSNPNTPRHLIEKVANSEDIPAGAVYPARDTLKKLDSESKD